MGITTREKRAKLQKMLQAVVTQFILSPLTTDAIMGFFNMGSSIWE